MVTNLRGTTWKIDEVKNYEQVRAQVKFSVFPTKTSSITCTEFVAEIYSAPIYLYHIVYKGVDGSVYTPYFYSGATGGNWDNVNCPNFHTIVFDDTEDIENPSLVKWINKNATFIPKNKYVHLYRNNEKIIVDAAFRDAAGYLIHERYVTKKEKKDLLEKIDKLTVDFDDLDERVQENLSSIQNLESIVTSLRKTLTEEKLGLIEDAIEALRGTSLSEIKGSIAANTILINRNKKSISEIDQRITDLAGDLNVTNTNLEKTNEKVSNIQNTLTVYNDRITTVEGQLSKITITSDQIDAIFAATKNATDKADIAINTSNTAKETADNTQADVNALKTTVAENKNRSEENKDDIVELFSLIEEAKTAYEAKDNELEGKIDTLQASYDQLQASYDQISLDHDTITSFTKQVEKIPGLETDLNELIGTVDNLIPFVSANTALSTSNTGRIETLEQQHKDTSSELTRLNELLEKTVKQDELQKLGTTVKENSGYIEVLQTESEDYKKRIGSLETDSTNQQAEINSTKSLLNSWISEIEKNTVDITGLRNDVDNFKEVPNKVANLEYSLDSLDERVETLEEDISTINKQSSANTNDIIEIKQDIDNLETAVESNSETIDEHSAKLVLQQMELDELKEEIDSKQANLVPGTNIEIVYNEETKETIINSTAQINNNWGGITGDVSEQTDLIEILNAKVEVSEEEPTDVEFSYQTQIDDIRSQLLALQKQLNGLTFVPTTQDEYEDLGTYDENTVYIAKEN